MRKPGQIVEIQTKAKGTCDLLLSLVSGGDSCRWRQLFWIRPVGLNLANFMVDHSLVFVA